MRIFAIAAALALTGCASAAVEQAEATAPKPGTAVAFNANSRAEYDDAAQRAEEWCRETYGERAHFVDRRAEPTGSVVRFGCTVD